MSKRFGDRNIFQDVHLDVSAGQMIALTGPSGSGKSTLLMIMSGLLRPDKGLVEVSVGVDSLDYCPMRPSLVAWIPQGNNALGARTVLDNAMLAALATGAKRNIAQAQAETALTKMGLAPIAQEPASVLSGGEQQRLAIARSLCSGRPFLFADEPTGSLDRANTLTVAAALRSASESGVTVVLATHDLSIARTCDRILHLDELLLREEDTS